MVAPAPADGLGRMIDDNYQ